MVRIINYKECVKEDGDKFYLLELQGGIEMVLSKASGTYYATTKRAYISSTFDEETCKSVIGNELHGNILKEECEPYKYTIKETGEDIILSHRWVYSPEKVKLSREDKAIQKLVSGDTSFSKNGTSELAEQMM